MELMTRVIIRNDSTVNWSSNDDQVLLKGEMGIEFTESGEPKIKIGDGVSTWAELKYFGGETAVQFFEVTPEGEETPEAAIARVAGTAVSNGAVAIVKVAIDEGKFEHTAYIYYDGWKAMDGNYNAENVYFDEDLVTTAAVGNIKLTNGQATIQAKGKNLKQVFDAIFVKESNPTTTQPSVTIKSTEAAEYEVGTKVTPSWDATFSAGKYSFGPNPTGVTVTSWEISDSDGNTASTEDGSFPEITVGDETDYTITAKANYGDGDIPTTNTGNPYAAGQIKAGSKSATTSTKLVGYRNTFFGTLEEKVEVTSAIIRGLQGKSEAALVDGSTFEVEIPVGAVRVVIAYPATLKDVANINDVNGLGSKIDGSFTKSTIAVEGVNGYEAVDYKVYVMDFAEANDTANKYTVEI